MTASYLMDFAHEVGVPLPPIDDSLQCTLQDFAARVGQWQQQQGLQTMSSAKEAFFSGLGMGVVADDLRQYASQWWTENETVVRAGVGLTALGFAAIAAG